jgi:hypothetical protein
MRPLNIKLYTYTEPKTGCKVVKAVTNYVGQSLYALAKCDPVDEFNQEFGEKLAIARLNIKVAKCRVQLAKERVGYANEYMNWMQKEYARVAKSLIREEACAADRAADLSAALKAEADLLATV